MSSPRVRVVVVNFNGGEHVLRCLQHLAKTEWSPDALDVVVVDNASTDGSADEIASQFPNVALLRSRRNLGYAGGNNLALADLDGVDYVALVNPDAFVEPGWLAPLVDAVASDPKIGAANPRVFLEPSYRRVGVRTEPWEPGGGDERTLGVRVSEIVRDGEDCWDHTVFPEGSFPLEREPAAPHFRWTGPEATLFLPVPTGQDEPAEFRLQVDADRTKPLVFDDAGTATNAEVGPGFRHVDLLVGGPNFDVINSAGARLVDGAYGAERGYGQPDGPHFDEAVEVFAWTGAVVLLDAAYLRDVGLLDAGLFLYSEELDLSWRGRLRGWRYVYVPESRARHVRGAIVGHRSAIADHYSHRNALLTLAKNAPGPVWRRELRRYVGDWWRFMRSEVFQRLRARRRPQPYFVRRRARVIVAVLLRLPRTLVARWTVGRRATVARQAVADGARRFDA
ncbi:MAG: glycosyltransferase [Actinobacteria bacterium]|nr:glycosyltransferase [Actinomycetota bacterium]